MNALSRKIIFLKRSKDDEVGKLIKTTKHL
jgi:hypothetical protein